MKTKITSLLALVALLYSCTPKETQSTETPEEVAESIAEATEEVTTGAVCVWDQVSVRQNPGPKEKYLTALSVGESLMYLGVDSLSGKRTYAKVQLNDETVGWTLKDFLVMEAKPAVVVRDASIYSRPDLLTKKDLSFAAMDIVASIETEGDWMQVRGKRSDGKWMDEGWIKADNISFNDIDIATAKFAKGALSLEGKEEKMAALQEIIENTDLESSSFMSSLVVQLTELAEQEAPIESDTTVVEEGE
ncbi:hypothetical protein BFP72_00540 [Reichenbachiella sp. 5M10]|uniref:SH3 domain-containing protein n=1 Tax=Reichenbachiella sp. 5M10 TaxID=1889772 RepID=UPI000C1563E7|nr:SH3 domain-containing protein [Reichenbachiella sp. 5M10]PIB34021.1 hypothetical protein BFP72_00540 [Reichenbachiella sp. 5M10]